MVTQNTPILTSAGFLEDLGSEELKIKELYLYGGEGKYHMWINLTDSGLQIRVKWKQGGEEKINNIYFPFEK